MVLYTRRQSIWFHRYRKIRFFQIISTSPWVVIKRFRVWIKAGKVCLFPWSDCGDIIFHFEKIRFFVGQVVFWLTWAMAKGPMRLFLVMFFLGGGTIVSPSTWYPQRLMDMVPNHHEDGTQLRWYPHLNESLKMKTQVFLFFFLFPTPFAILFFEIKGVVIFDDFCKILFQIVWNNNL